jgi:diguanylate cyclase
MQVESDASLDPLTGLANRHRFDMTLRDAVRHANAESAPLTLLMLDIDHFKRFNDTLGHLMGDHVLRLTARVMTGQTRQGDLVARYGGEEFAIVLPGASLAVGAAVAEQIRQVMERRPVADRGDGQRVGAATCSVGVAQYRSGEMAEDLIERADQAMYRAKRAGRNRVETDGPPPAWDRASRDVSISGSYIEHY